MRLVLHIPDGEAGLELGELRQLFPAIALEVVRGGDAALSADAWAADDFDFWAFDRWLDDTVARAQPVRLAVPRAEATRTARQVATRAQRLAPRRNGASRTPWFEHVLAQHRRLHDLEQPLVRADLDHAHDTWQWTLRRDPDASGPVQLAALLHDLERLVSEPTARVEHRAPDYQAFKNAHARAGAEVARALLEIAGVPASTIASACALIAVHEHAVVPLESAAGVDEPELRALNDADALSFFSLNSPGYLAYFGPEQTARKVDYTLRRMSPVARRELAALRVPRFVAACLERSATCGS